MSENLPEVNQLGKEMNDELNEEYRRLEKEYAAKQYQGSSPSKDVVVNLNPQTSRVASVVISPELIADDKARKVLEITVLLASNEAVDKYLKEAKIYQQARVDAYNNVIAKYSQKLTEMFTGAPKLPEVPTTITTEELSGTSWNGDIFGNKSRKVGKKD